MCNKCSTIEHLQIIHSVPTNAWRDDMKHLLKNIVPYEPNRTNPPDRCLSELEIAGKLEEWRGRIVRRELNRQGATIGGQRVLLRRSERVFTNSATDSTATVSSELAAITLNHGGVSASTLPPVSEMIGKTSKIETKWELKDIADTFTTVLTLLDSGSCICMASPRSFYCAFDPIRRSFRGRASTGPCKSRQRLIIPCQPLAKPGLTSSW